MRNGPSEEVLKNFYEAIKPSLIRIIKEDKAKETQEESDRK